MTVTELQRSQEAVLPKEDLKPYAGRWVALRDGYVVADDDSAVALRDRGDVRPDDLLMPVPTEGAGAFIL